MIANSRSPRNDSSKFCHADRQKLRGVVEKRAELLDVCCFGLATGRSRVARNDEQQIAAAAWHLNVRARSRQCERSAAQLLQNNQALVFVVR